MEVGVGDLVDVLDPFAVRAKVVGALDNIFSQPENSTAVHSLHVPKNVSTYQTNHLDVALLEFILQLGESTQLGGADGGKVGRVGEEDGPAVSDKLVKVNVAVGGLGREVGGCQLVSIPDFSIIRTNWFSWHVPVAPRRNRGCSWGMLETKRRVRGCGARGSCVQMPGRTVVRGTEATRGRVLRARKAVWGRIAAIVDVV